MYVGLFCQTQCVISTHLCMYKYLSIYASVNCLKTKKFYHKHTHIFKNFYWWTIKRKKKFNFVLKQFFFVQISVQQIFISSDVSFSWMHLTYAEISLTLNSAQKKNRKLLKLKTKGYRNYCSYSNHFTFYHLQGIRLVLDWNSVTNLTALSSKLLDWIRFYKHL